MHGLASWAKVTILVAILMEFFDWALINAEGRDFASIFALVDGYGPKVFLFRDRMIKGR